MHRSKCRFDVYRQILHQSRSQVSFLEKIFKIDVRRCDVQNCHVFVDH